MGNEVGKEQRRSPAPGHYQAPARTTPSPEELERKRREKEEEKLWIEEAKRVGPPEPHKPFYDASQHNEELYKQYMIEKYNYEQWENSILLLARRLYKDSNGTPAAPASPVGAPNGSVPSSPARSPDDRSQPPPGPSPGLRMQDSSQRLIVAENERRQQREHEAELQRQRQAEDAARRQQLQVQADVELRQKQRQQQLELEHRQQQEREARDLRRRQQEEMLERQRQEVERIADKQRLSDSQRGLPSLGGLTTSGARSANGGDLSDQLEAELQQHLRQIVPPAPRLPESVLQRQQLQLDAEIERNTRAQQHAELAHMERERERLARSGGSQGASPLSSSGPAAPGTLRAQLQQARSSGGRARSHTAGGPGATMPRTMSTLSAPEREFLAAVDELLAARLLSQSDMDFVLDKLRVARGIPRTASPLNAPSPRSVSRSPVGASPEQVHELLRVLRGFLMEGLINQSDYDYSERDALQRLAR
eukprot:TRINITY_DN22782_c0_g1_i1.p1 TRINITY_DN22782_c0_g1~~TRINITY_DN22782_c0_g1_i1.p1  ORF type:complete len:479 (+),score=132.99 TRINITY_DN22782_c0_g1_i1:157-1593(+)